MSVTNLNLKTLFRCHKIVCMQICHKTTRHQRPKWILPDRQTKRIPFNEGDHADLTLNPPEQPENPKNLKVSVIGMPNAGKSTLINSLIGVEVLPTSTKVDTTVTNCLGILTLDDTQIEFFDSPGLFSRKSSIRNKNSPSYGLSGEVISRSDLCLVVADLSSRRVSGGRLQPEVTLQLLRNRGIPSVLVLNKIDRISHRSNLFRIIEQTTCGVVDGRPCGHHKSTSRVLNPIKLPPLDSAVIETMTQIDRAKSPDEIKVENRSEQKVLNDLRNLSGWPGFKEVFVTSALKYEVINELRDYLLGQARPRQWGYHSDMITDVTPYNLLCGIMRSSMLDNLGHEIPYMTQVRVSYCDESEDKLTVAFDLLCNKTNHARIVDRGRKLVVFGARKRLEKLHGGEIEIDVVVYFKGEPIH